MFLAYSSINVLATLLAYAGSRTTVTANADPRWLVALWTHNHNVRSMDRGFKLDNSGLRLTAACLHRALMLLADVHRLDDHTIGFGKAAHNPATRALVVACNNFNDIALFYK
jgi:hypothetical protein